jgi:photosystem II stability/assembly factor-like uncharacterized protein
MSAAIHGNTIFATDAAQGMYLSHDLGKTWAHVTNGMSIWSYGLNTLVHNDTILAAGDGVFRSTDNGNTWTQLCNDIQVSDLLSIAWTGKNILLCCGYSGDLYFSHDNGQTWNPCPEHVPDYYVSGAAFLGQDIFVASDVNGIYKSTDNGATYTLSNNGLSNLLVTTIEARGDKLYAGTGTGLFVSSDHGANWNSIGNNLFLNAGIKHLAFEGSVILAGGYSGLIFSMNDGATWTKVVHGLPDSRIESVAVSGSTFLAGTASGLYFSANSGQTWSAIGLPLTYVSYLSGNGTDLFACASQMTGGIFVTPDQGENWNFLFGGIPTNDVSAIAWNNTDLLAATDSGVFLSSDRGLSWMKKSNGIPEMDPYNNLTAIACNGNNLYCGTYSTGIFVSHNGGENWTHATLPVLDTYYAMSFYIGDEGVYAGTFCAGILFSSDFGQTWVSRNSGLPVVTSHTAFAKIGSKLFVATYGGVFVTTDNGISWSNAGSELNGKVIYGMTSHGNDLFAATSENGIYMSKDSGNSWFQVNDGLTFPIRALSIAVNGSWLYMGTDGQGVWKHSYNF